MVHNFCLVHTDYLPLLWYPADLDVAVKPVDWGGALRIVHATNHRALKGTDALIATVDDLRAAGHAIDLVILDNQPRQRVMDAMADAHLVVDQLLFRHGLTALEALSLGKAVITAEFDDPMYDPFRAHFSDPDTPLIAASTTTIGPVIEALLKDRERVRILGEKARTYVETYHDDAATVALFEQVYAGLDK